MSDQFQYPPGQYDGSGIATAPSAMAPPAPPAGGIDTTDISGASPQANPNAQAPDVQPAPGYANPPEGNPIQAGVQAAESALAPPGPIPPTGQTQTGAGGPPQAGPPMITKMLGGDGAAPIQTVKQAAQGVDPHNTQPPGNQNIMAVDAAVQKGDTKGAIALMQGNRVAFNAKQAFASTALNGTPQKPADINAAIDAANQAEQHVLDGSNVKFAHAAHGQVTATVTMAGTGQPQTIPLTVDQFRQFLDLRTNHWDKLMNQTVPATLQQIASSNVSTALSSRPTPQAQPGQTAPDHGQTGGEDEAHMDQGGGQDKMGRSTNPDPVARQYEDSHGFVARTKFDEGSDDELLYRANRMFPPNTIGNQKEREEWIAKQQESEAERKNRLDVRTQQGENALKVAHETGQNRQGQETIKQAGAGNVATIKKEGYEGRTAALKDIAKTKADQTAATAQARQTLEMAKRNAINVSNADRAVVSHWNAREAQQAINPYTNEEKKQYAEDMQRIRERSQGAAPAPGTQVPTGQAARPPTSVAAPNQDTQAIAWAKANPNDPRSAKILAKNGM